jgi:hypothetical protein
VTNKTVAGGLAAKKSTQGKKRKTRAVEIRPTINNIKPMVLLDNRKGVDLDLLRPA